MILVSAEVGPFRSINTTQTVNIDGNVTVLVGMNEAGKTVFLKALHKSLDAMEFEQFDPVEDYPRKDLSAYMRRHPTTPEAAITLTYQSTNDEIARINAALHTNLKPDFQFSVAHKYDNSRSITISVDEAPAIEALAASPGLSADTVATIKKAKTVRQIADLLVEGERTETDKTFLTALQARIKKTTWNDVVRHEAWKLLDAQIPKFLYFSDYDLLPGKLNLTDLARRVGLATSEPNNARKHLQPKHQAILALLRMADVVCSISGGKTTCSGGGSTL